MALPNASSQLAELLNFGQASRQDRSSRGGGRRGASEPRASEASPGERRSAAEGSGPPGEGGGLDGAGGEGGFHGNGGLLSGMLGVRLGSGSNLSPRPPREASPGDRASSPGLSLPQGPSHVREPAEEDWAGSALDERQARAFERSLGLAEGSLAPQSLATAADDLSGGEALPEHGGDAPFGGSDGGGGAEGSSSYHASYHSSYHEQSYLSGGGGGGASAGGAFGDASTAASGGRPVTSASHDPSVSSRVRPRGANLDLSRAHSREMEGGSPSPRGGFGSPSAATSPGGGFGSPEGSGALPSSAFAAGSSGEPSVDAWGAPSPSPTVGLASIHTPTMGSAEERVSRAPAGQLSSPYGSAAVSSVGRGHHSHRHHHTRSGKHRSGKHGRSSTRNSPRAGPSPRAHAIPDATVPSGAWTSEGSDDSFWAMRGAGGVGSPLGSGIGVGGGSFAAGVGASPLGSGGVGVGSLASGLGSSPAPGSSPSPLGSSPPVPPHSSSPLGDGAYSSGFGSAYGALYERSAATSYLGLGDGSFVGPGYGLDPYGLTDPASPLEQPDAEGAALLSSTAPGASAAGSRDLGAALAASLGDSDRAADGGTRTHRSSGGSLGLSRERSAEGASGAAASADGGRDRTSGAAPQPAPQTQGSAASSPRAGSLILPLMALSDRVRGRRRGKKKALGDAGGGRDGGDAGGAGGPGAAASGPSNALGALSPGLNGPARALPKGATKRLAVRRWLSVDREGGASLLDLGKLKVMLTLGVQLRDLRLLDPLLATSYPSAILARDRAIVVNMEFVKAIITADAVLVTNLEDPAALAFVQLLRTRLAAAAQAERVARELSGGAGPYPGYGPPPTMHAIAERDERGSREVGEARKDDERAPATSFASWGVSAASRAAPRGAPSPSAPSAPSRTHKGLPRPTSAAQLALASVAVAPVTGAVTGPVTSAGPGLSVGVGVGGGALTPGVGPRGALAPLPALAPGAVAPLLPLTSSGAFASPVSQVPASSASARALAPPPSGGASAPALLPEPPMTELPHLAPADSSVPLAALPLPPALVDLPFEHRALEVVLESVCGHLGALSGELEAVAHPALDALTSGVDTARLETVRRVKTRLVRLTTRVETAREVLERFLDDDSDMKDLNLTAREEERREQEAAERAAAEREAGRAASVGRGPPTPSSLASRGRWNLPSHASAGSFSRLHPAHVARVSRRRLDRKASSTPRRRGKGKNGAGAVAATATVPAFLRGGGAGNEHHQRVPLSASAVAGDGDGTDVGVAGSSQGASAHPSVGLPPAPRNWRPRGPLGRLVPWSPSHRWPGFATAEAGQGAGGPLAPAEGAGGDGDDDGCSSLSSADSSSQTSEEVEAVERLLEQYFMRLDATRHRLKTLCEYIEDTEDYVNIELDSIRNDIFRYDLFISTVTASVAIVIAVTSLFAMNLELRPNLPGQGPYSWFLAITISLCVFTIFFFWGIIAFCRHKGLY